MIAIKLFLQSIGIAFWGSAITGAVYKVTSDNKIQHTTKVKALTITEEDIQKKLKKYHKKISKQQAKNFPEQTLEEKYKNTSKKMEEEITSFIHLLKKSNVKIEKKEELVSKLLTQINKEYLFSIALKTKFKPQKPSLTTYKKDLENH